MMGFVIMGIYVRVPCMAYQKSIEDDASSMYRKTSSSPFPYSYLNEKEPPLKIVSGV